MDKLVYFFAKDHTDGNAGMKDLLGGKGANLAEMTSIGIPVPPGFTLSTRACNLYFEAGHQMPRGLDREVDDALARLESLHGQADRRRRRSAAGVGAPGRSSRCRG